MGIDKADNGENPEKINDSYILTEEQVKLMIERKADFLAGKTTSREWNEIKKQYEIK